MNLIHHFDMKPDSWVRVNKNDDKFSRSSRLYDKLEVGVQRVNIC